MLDGAWPARSDDVFHSTLADLEETDDAFLLEVELPGVRKSDVDVRLPKAESARRRRIAVR